VIGHEKANFQVLAFLYLTPSTTLSRLFQGIEKYQQICPARTTLVTALAIGLHSSLYTRSPNALTSLSVFSAKFKQQDFLRKMFKALKSVLKGDAMTGQQFLKSIDFPSYMDSDFKHVDNTEKKVSISLNTNYFSSDEIDVRKLIASCRTVADIL